MNSQESPEVLELFSRIKNCAPNVVAFAGVVFRSVGLRFANEEDILSGDGAATFGGRWSPRRLSAVYMSLKVETATLESYQNLLKTGFRPEDFRPRLLIGARVRFCRLLDLTGAATRRRIGFTLGELIEEDWQTIQQSGEESWTQAIGRGCHTAGFEGLIAPSARDRPRGKNLVYFPNQLDESSRVELLGREDLPPASRGGDR